ncbi:hypothetical protein HYPBUDRAFT_123501 [Hyphopichia burtonii NRRL Y-1933]|uniref:Nitrogen regulatory protein areA GATA-like domain-containing protein n=1 Tax=Hyphopichia burtonii NRRL Y-1933 TaxID=984485 RepID=A0A1E4RM10_9ASCO|nr:hypothetical protein HYPBUDRAFT_123501 [Hyphopichia burtonii NRRL Y-1933]ODV68145.1 hypothetical protein HYPBUDRAFT_123501 [Hyphopichia burtonii NRRL Y-1933]
MSSTNNLGDVFTGGATTSQHVDAEDDDHFENTTFKLKRTRSLGLLDEFIDPSEQEKIIQQQNNTKSEPAVDDSDENEIDERYTIIDDTESPLSSVQSTTSASNSSKSPSPVTTIKSPEILPHDDTDLTSEPSRHVDYLSHQWDVSDISKSWRYVISKRKDVANSARLENASWRTWAQRRSNLKTISPEVVNWSKDSDVTWLYGPILNDDESNNNNNNNNNKDDNNHHHHQTTATSAVAGDISIPNKSKKGPKPILKRRTVQDMMISHLNLLKLQLATNRLQDRDRRRSQRERIEAANSNYDETHPFTNDDDHDKSSNEKPPEYFDYDAISAKLNSQYKNYSNPTSNLNSSTDLTGLNNSNSSNTSLKDHNSSPNNDTNFNDNDNSNVKYNNDLTDNSINDNTNQNNINDNNDNSTSIPKNERRIHFNDEVQQCIAIDDYDDEDGDYDDEYDDDSQDDDSYYYDDESEDSYIYETPNRNENDDTVNDLENDDDEDEEEDDEGGFFLNVKSSNIQNVPGLGSSTSKDSTNSNSDSLSTPNANDNTEDTDLISTNNSKFYRTIQLLPPTSLNYGSSDEESDEENPYTSSLSHNVNNNSSRGYDYYYDYNTVYTVDPNHAIYGSNAANKTPDVVDVPDNITMGLNFDYDIIENEEFDHKNSNIQNNDYSQNDERNSINVPVINPAVVNNNNINYSSQFPQHSMNNDQAQKERLPISALDDSAANRLSPKNSNSDDEEESDSDSDDEGGLSISARNSSQSLAQLIFGNSNMTSTNDDKERHFPASFEEPSPIHGHMSSMNPNHSSTELSKQPHSSHSLSESFFVGGTNELTKKRRSSSALADQFFNLSLPSQDNDNENNYKLDSSDYKSSSPSEVQKKSSPLPPYMNSANAFSGRSTSPNSNSDQISSANSSFRSAHSTLPPRHNTFMFDSDSDSEDEYVEDASPPPTDASPQSENIRPPNLDNPSSYSSLAQVADRNGIKSPSPDNSHISDNLNEAEKRNFVGQARGLASQFLENWKHHE